MTLASAALSLSLCLCCVPQLFAASGSRPSIEQQRAWFSAARQALKDGRTDDYIELKGKLSGYPLTPYLDIWKAWKQLDAGDDTAIAATLERFAAIPESRDLRAAWVKDLARRGRWKQVTDQLKTHPRLRRSMRGIAMMADWKAGDTKTAMQSLSHAWTHAAALNGITDPLQQAWADAGHPTATERCARITRLAGYGAWQEVRTLSKNIAKSDAHWLDDWQRLQSDPAAFSGWTALPASPQPDCRALPGHMLRDTLKRLARKDPLQAHQSLQALRHRHGRGIGADDVASLERQVALEAARQHLPDAAAWLQALPEAKQDGYSRAWRTRLLMLQHDWKQVLQAIRAMPAAQRRRDSWQYWMAYALEATGEEQKAKPVFTRLAAGRGYYAFLSAERLGLSYRFGNEPLVASAARVNRLQDKPGIRRAHEWLALGNEHKAVREWYVALHGANRKTWKAAATIAMAWNWTAQAVRAVNRAGASDDLEGRFPLAYPQHVLAMAQQTGLQPSTIWGVIRQESLFDRQALSPAGGHGLMQLLPRTGRMVAKHIGLRHAQRNLFSPEVNIRLGSHYLADLKARFDDNLVLATAAYNAGPRRVDRWLARTPFESAEVWVEAIPYNETRRYVQHVLAYSIVYQWRENGQPVRSLTQLINGQRTLSLNETDKRGL